MNLKQKIKIQCIKSGNVSLSELARRCGYKNPNFITKVNSGHWRIPELQDVAKALNCTLYTAFEYKDGELFSSDNISELIRIQCVVADDITLSELADRVGWSRSSLNNRLSLNKWLVSDLELIAHALDSRFIIEFRSIS